MSLVHFAKKRNDERQKCQPKTVHLSAVNCSKQLQINNVCRTLVEQTVALLKGDLKKFALLNQYSEKNVRLLSSATTWLVQLSHTEKYRTIDSHNIAWYPL